MKIPQDIPLHVYIKQLIANDKVAEFYQTDEWKALRQEVLEDCFYECQECLKKGNYTRADCVHHVNEVRKNPALALSRYYTDKDGNKQMQLVPLCNACHNLVHDKLGEWQNKDKYRNAERW